MVIKYGNGWMQFPDVVWEISESAPEKWVSRLVTIEDTNRRKELATEEPDPAKG